MSAPAPSPDTLVKLKNRFEVAERTMAFQLEKPAGWTFKAGQAIDLTLLNPPETDAEGNTRAFSLAGAPHEPDLMVATRLRDTAFKRVFQKLPLGAHVKIDAAFVDELESVQRQNPNYQFIPTMTDMSKSKRPWRGETARINKEMLAKYL